MSKRWIAFLGVALLLSAATAWGQVTRTVYNNPIAGFSLEIPDDWEMGTGVPGTVLIGLNGDQSDGVPYGQPILWFFYSKQAPQATANTLADTFKQLYGVTVTPQAVGQSGAWELAFTHQTDRGAFQQHWVCRTQDGHSYVIGAVVPQEIAAACQADLDRALSTCKLIARPLLRRFQEPQEHAYRMTLPRDWVWEGQVFRAEGVPGYFTWKAQSPDHLAGAFSAPPGVFNIAVAYLPASEAARVMILPELQKQIPGLRLDKVQELPRVGGYYCAIVRALGLGANPRIDKARADYLATLNGTEIRLRVTVATVMLDTSPMLGGRGDWFLMANGAWAPSAHFDEQYPLGRGVIASLATDPAWKNAQFEAANDVVLWRNWVSRVQQFLFNAEYLESEDTLHLP